MGGMGRGGWGNGGDGCRECAEAVYWPPVCSLLAARRDHVPVDKIGRFLAPLQMGGPTLFTTTHSRLLGFFR